MNLLITGAWRAADGQLAALKDRGHTVLVMPDERGELPCDPAWVEGVIANGLFLYHPIESFTSLRYVQLTSAGFDRMPMDYAAEKGVALAFENLRMVGNLACLVDRYADRDNVRFCLDVGHEHCYTKTVTWMDIFTDKLFCTHIHDNVGRPFYDKVNDFDQHLLPFDGTCNYHRMMQKLDEYGYTGALTLEISRNARDDYKEMSGDAFLATAYDRLKRISVLNAPTVEKEI